jgi:hypothetical protein
VIDCPPTFSRVPDGDESTGTDCCDLAAAYSIGLDGWQRDIVRGILRERDGGWSAAQAGVVVSRQSGKGNVLLALELFGLYELGEQILHTSHATKTSSDAFRRLWSVVKSYPELERRVKKFTQMLGCEFVELDNGSRITFSTRSPSAGRGLTIDRLIVDEAEDLPAAEIAALQPTVFSRPRSQTIFTGTAPGPMHDAESFETLRKTAHDGLNNRLAWWEWAAEYGSDIDDESLWLRVNPSVASGRISIEAIRNDRSVLPPDAFRAERLSMWVPRSADGAVFTAEEWDGLCDPGSAPISDLSIGVDVPPSRDAATICLAGKRDDGRIHVEWYETRQGVQWVPQWISERLNERVRAVVIDERGQCAELEWIGAKVRPTMIGHHDVAVAAGLFHDGITEATLRHRAQVELSKGVLAARQRPLGQAFAWDRKAAGSSALVAATLALFGVSMERPLRPRRDDRKRRVIVLR